MLNNKILNILVARNLCQCILYCIHITLEVIQVMKMAEKFALNFMLVGGYAVIVDGILCHLIIIITGPDYLNSIHNEQTN